ncbi:nucleotidyl transferase AbiEii/AbiGii toxin family protein [Deinococcus sp.]|uniref:nucleotidyl transferase AbiEii/AbiGii toxin family protein n=1 Tax=Deinococcus sp. TaxID=47478 RepID=UPI003B59ECE7
MTRITDPNPVSLLARLRHLGRTVYPNLPANTMLLLYAQQGVLARLEQGFGEPEPRFVLKGALSLFARYGNAARPTEDMDLAAQGLPNTPAEIEQAIRALCRVPFDDGLSFDPGSVRAVPINQTLAYPGAAVRLRASLGKSKVDLQIDVSFGNVILPTPLPWVFPSLLLAQAVHVYLYPLETVITEKFAALLEIGVATTRMKDLYDLEQILSRESFAAELMCRVLEGSFAARGTPRSAVASTLGETFAASPELNRRWTQYLNRTGFESPAFAAVMALLRAFYGPLLLGGRREGRWQPAQHVWLDEAERTD